MRLNPLPQLALLVVLVTAPGCGQGDPAAPDSTLVKGEQPAPVDTGPEVPTIASPKANVRFLNAARMSKTFAKALGLPENELCKELGQYQCVDLIHKISLLGTDPYLFGVNDPLPSTTTSTPLVAERVATAGCVERATRDRAAQGRPSKPPNGALFYRIVIDANGKTNPDAPELATTVDQLYVRAVQRHARAGEIEQHRQLYRDIEALPSAKPAEDWAIASCVSVLTSMEALFY